MACSKYTLTNTGSTVVNFNYRRCDDSLWEYQVGLNPNQTKNIWLINGTYSISPVYAQSISLINLGAFPPISQTATPTPTPTQTPTQTTTPTETPTNTPTPTNTGTPTETPTNTPTNTLTNTPTNTETPTNTPTPTNTQTPTNTETPTETPTNTPTNTLTNTPTNTETPTPTPTNTETPTNTPTPTVTPTSPLQEFIVTTGVTSNESCNSIETITLYAFDPIFDQNTQFYNESTGSVTINLTGFYSDSSSVTELDSTGAQVGYFSLCSVLPTQTPTQTNTPSPTPTFGYYTYSLGTGATSNDACVDFGSTPNTIYGTVSGGIGPNVGEYLYFNTLLTIPVIDGYYSNGTAWYQVTGGLGQITSSDPNGCI